MKSLAAIFLTLTLGLSVGLTGCIHESEDGEEIVISSECTWYVGAECEFACETTDFNMSCKADCDSLDVDLPSCQGSCQGSCEGECEVTSGDFSCEGYCSADCGAYCQGECATAENSASCEAECGAFCDGECSASCQGTPPSASCEGACEASCEGQCNAGNVEFDCYAECQIDMPLECQGDCDADGMLECNNSYVLLDKSDLQSAIDWVEANMSAEVTFEGDAECHDNTCSAEGSCQMECAVGSPGTHSPVGGILFIASLVGFLWFRRGRD